VRMALSALDDEEVPLYFGGREALVKAVYRGRLESDPRRRQTQYRYVRRLVRGLRGAKLIEPLDKADPRARAVRAQYPRVRAVYALNRAALEHGQGVPVEAPLAADEETSQGVPPGGPPPRSPGGTRRTHEGGLVGPHKEEGGGKSSSSRATVGGAPLADDDDAADEKWIRSIAEEVRALRSAHGLNGWHLPGIEPELRHPAATMAPASLREHALKVAADPAAHTPRMISIRQPSPAAVERPREPICKDCRLTQPRHDFMALKTGDDHPFEPEVHSDVGATQWAVS
jgi:hypothetical protein